MWTRSSLTESSQSYFTPTPSASTLMSSPITREQLPSTITTSSPTCKFTEARGLTFKNSPQRFWLENQKVFRCQIPHKGLLCGRPSGLVVTSQYVDADLSKFSAQPHGCVGPGAVWLKMNADVPFGFSAFFNTSAVMLLSLRSSAVGDQRDAPVWLPRFMLAARSRHRHPKRTA
ncbi:protein of unknown function [Streptantibioticus cattleyicolor NRRL 8057 = DSM 46488]|nr:protein of unknown function [Streptantibioticus cattleyicolor NRRL 8057 = DSM 46488]